jgi:mannose-6-phosphate isomerase-like protein (cupin superfamily)
LNNYINGNPGEGCRDHGKEPYVLDIDRAAKCNTNYRTTIWTGEYLQSTLMSIPAGTDIGLEIHPDTDQFIRVESGQGMALMGKSEDNLSYRKQVCDGYAVFVPAGTWHNIVNTGRCALKLYTIYAPPHHPRGTVHVTKQDAIEQGD